MHPHEIYSEKKMKTKKKNHHHSCSNCLEIFLAFCKSSFSWRHMRNGPAVESTWYVKGEQSLQSLIYQMAWGAAVPSLSQCWRRTEKTKQETQPVCHSHRNAEKIALCTMRALICLMLPVAVSQDQRERPRSGFAQFTTKFSQRDQDFFPSYFYNV